MLTYCFKIKGRACSRVNRTLVTILQFMMTLLQNNKWLGFILPRSTHQDLKTLFLYKTSIDWLSNESVGFPKFNFKGPPSSKSHCDRLFLFWISLLSKRVIWLAERRQAVRKRAPSRLVLVSFKRLILQIYTEMWPNIYKIAQENYRMINRERIYTGGLKYMCRIRF